MMRGQDLQQVKSLAPPTGQGLERATRENQQPMLHLLLGVNATEQGGVTGMTAGRHAGCWEGRWEPLKQTCFVPTAVKMNAFVQTAREVPRVHLDPGSSLTVPVSCERKTDYTKLLLDCEAGNRRVHQALGTALSEFSGSMRETIRRNMVLAYDEWEAVDRELARYRHQRRSDSYTQTEAPRSIRRSVPAA